MKIIFATVLIFLATLECHAELASSATSASSLWMPSLSCPSSNFINGNLYTLDNANVNGNKPYATASLINPSTKRSLDRLELRVGDQSCGDAARGDATVERAEFGQGTVYSFATDFWVAYSVYYVAGTAFSSTTITGQVHPSDCNASDAFLTTIADINPTNSGKDLTFFAINSTENPIVHAPTVTTAFTDTNGLVTGQWINFVWHLKLSAGGSGLWDVWKNGSLLFHYTGSVGLASCANKYFKYGIYRGVNVSNGTNVIWYANIESGPTDLTARITSPLSVPVGTVN